MVSTRGTATRSGRPGTWGKSRPSFDAQDRVLAKLVADDGLYQDGEEGGTYAAPQIHIWVLLALNGRPNVGWCRTAVGFGVNLQMSSTAQHDHPISSLNSS